MSPGRKPSFSPASTAGLESITRSTFFSISNVIATETARKLLPVPAGPRAITISFSLNDFIDGFIIAEATRNHSGERKKLNFNINNFQKFKKKINYVVVDDIPKDIDKAIYYLSAAAAQGQVNAMTTVGWTYFTGEHGAPQDNDEAIYWNQKASDAGFTVASYNIGFFYYSGLAGLEQDLIMAKKYWLLSASQWLNSEGLHDATAEGLLDEINEYNPNPTKEMIELRDFYIMLLKSNPS